MYMCTNTYMHVIYTNINQSDTNGYLDFALSFLPHSFRPHKYETSLFVFLPSYLWGTKIE